MKDKEARSHVTKHEELDARTKARREFVSKFGKAAATAPAITLLLSAGSKRAFAVRGSFID
ncbi:MAG: hypothetical protein GY791_19790 [Alphaproteobacteria bacterium]|nr:hypothetical protein [Alphaproteobacteria bacterium]